jgi:glycosyltransferase involved in cell wall biosynthesis
MRAFYLQADAIYSPSAFYRDQLAEHGFPREKMFIFQRGTDLEFYNPRHRDETYFATWNVRNKFVFIYTGRISKEKNLDLICEAFVADPFLQEHAALALIGDGPYRETIAARYSHPAIIFPGFLKGKPLARAYASADCFVFPSTTDTYGNSVLEAQASGLPALVSDEGGPKEIIVPDKTGFVLPGHDRDAWRAAMRKLAEQPELKHQMAAAARAHTATRDWATAFHEFWDENPYANIYANTQTSKQANIA